MGKIAKYFSFDEDSNQVICRLCPKNCTIADGKRGACGVRRRDKKSLITENYGLIAGSSIDPIEKKPLYHFFPTRDIYSVGTLGCNLSCDFCQNSHLSHPKSPELSAEKTPPERLVLHALQSGSFGIAYTYSEPSVWYEFILDAARMAKTNGLKNILVTNGYLNPKPLEELLPFIDAANIDLKSFRNESYRKIGGDLETVKQNIETFLKHGVHAEITSLLVTGFNCNQDEIEAIAKWIASIGERTVLHLSRYFPSFNRTSPATSTDFMKKAKEIASQYLRYVYLGNVTAENSTYCQSCGNLLVSRNFYDVEVRGLDENGVCLNCGAVSDIIMK